MSRSFLLLLGLAMTGLVAAQQLPLTYYLPDISYDGAIPTPESAFGWQVGTWHLSHDLQQQYMRRLAELSDRITLTEYARSHEGRPLVYLTITSPENHARLAELKTAHLRLLEDGNASLDGVPLVLYQGFSIHGNEASGANAAPLVAYYLAAGNSPEVQQLLNETIILLDPSFNPDGMQRFSSWVNMHKNDNLTSDPQDREYREAWPGGRTNHYWYDLNRDWLPVQQPESRGRVAVFHEWKPNILTDHHEMGSNATFFFMPGEPTRVHPLTPARNQELTAAIGNFHAEALDRIGSLYYSREGYDDFFYGKGSTYPDVNGAVGILFEQGSSRGHLQETENGLLSFPFTIRNQVTTALSTQRAAVALKNDLLTFQRNFYRDVKAESRADERAGFVFGDDGDPARAAHLVDILQRHQIAVHQLAKEFKGGGHTFRPGQSFYVPLNQPQYRLVKAVFEPMTEFEDSLFYDVSTWTLPYAFNLPYSSTVAKSASGLAGERLTTMPATAPPPPGNSQYAYLVNWDDYYAPKAAYRLLSEGLRVKVSQNEFGANGRTYRRGTLLVTVQNQDKSVEEVQQIVNEVAANTHVPIEAVATGLTAEGSDLGSRSFSTLRKPEVLLLIGDGVSPYDAGEVWHLLDQRYDIPITKVSTTEFGGVDLSRYTAIIMADGRYNSLGSGGANKLRGWLSQGNVLIAIQRAAEWCNDNGLAQLTVRPIKEDSSAGRRPYSELQTDEGGRELGGAIFAAEADLTHPLLYGYQRPELPVFRQGNFFFEPAKNRYASPLVYRRNARLSGYVHSSALKTIDGSAAAVINGVGRGRTICLADNPCFRAFWFGTDKLLANAVFFGEIISGGAVESVGSRQ